MPKVPFREWVDAARARAVALASRTGAGPAATGVVGFAVGLAALPAIALGHSWLGLVFVLLGRAIAMGGTAQELRAALDVVFFASLPFAFALADPGRALAAAFLLFAFAASIAVSKRIALADEFAATIAAVIACVFPERFSLIAYGLGVACFVVAGLRIAGVTTRNGA